MKKLLVRIVFLISIPVLVWAFLAVERRVTGVHAASVVSRSGSPGSLTLLSETHVLDRLYGSMQGPYGIHRGIRLLEDGSDELLWLRGIEVRAVDPGGETEVSPEFFCHANLTLADDGNGNRLQEHNRLFNHTTHIDLRLFTLVPGRLQIQLPAGFGIPIYSQEPLDMLSMSLNQSVTDRTLKLRFRTEVDFVKDADLTETMKPLFRRALYGYETVNQQVAGIDHSGGDHPGQSCGPYLGVPASEHGFVSALGTEKAIHWMVPPGPYEASSPVTDQMDLPFDTTVHYVTAHLHPGGKSLTLYDRTEDRVLFTLEGRDFEDRWGVAHMDELTIPEGVMIHRDHEYELITVYENAGSENIDAMAILYLYLHDRTFDPDAAS